MMVGSAVILIPSCLFCTYPVQMALTSSSIMYLVHEETENVVARGLALVN